MLVNPKPKKFTHGQLKYSSQKSTAPQKGLGPPTAGLARCVLPLVHRPAAMAGQAALPRAPTTAFPTGNFLPSALFIWSRKKKKKILSVALNYSAFSRQISLSVTAGTAQAALPRSSSGERPGLWQSPRLGCHSRTPQTAQPHRHSPVETSQAMQSLRASLSAARLRLKNCLLNLRAGSARRDGLNQGAGRSSSHGV